MVVLGLHVLGLLLALRLGAWADRGPTPQPAPLLVWLQVQPAAAARHIAPRTAIPKPRAPLAITSPAIAPPIAPLTEAAAPAVVTVQPPTAEAPAPAAPRALDLTLPRGASAPWRGRNPALDDPRANTARTTLEDRIARALGGSDLITEFRLEDGSVRLRRGNACVVVRPNRAQALDPFNGSAQLRPRLLDRC